MRLRALNGFVVGQVGFFRVAPSHAQDAQGLTYSQPAGVGHSERFKYSCCEARQIGQASSAQIGDDLEDLGESHRLILMSCQDWAIMSGSCDYVYSSDLSAAGLLRRFEDVSHMRMRSMQRGAL